MSVLAMMAPLDGAAQRVAAKLRAELDAKALEVLATGKDWAEGPMTTEMPEFPESYDPLRPPAISMTCKCGPVDPDWVPPHGWRVIRHADWVAAGKPGLVE